MQYQEAVAEAKRLVTRSEDDQWRLAQLTYEQVEAGKSRRQWAADIGIASGRAIYLYTVWARYGQAPDRPSFYEAVERVNQPGRYEDAEGIGSRHQEAAKSAVRNMPPEQKAAVVREALDDPDVATRTMRDPHTRRNVTDARERVVEEIQSSNRDREDANPVGRAVREATLELEIENDISAARFKLAEAARKLMDLDAHDPAVMDRMGRAAGEVDTALGWLRTVIAGGRVDDDELTRLLEGGDA